jgi:hypothetical protein
MQILYGDRVIGRLAKIEGRKQPPEYLRQEASEGHGRERKV